MVNVKTDQLIVLHERDAGISSQSVPDPNSFFEEVDLALDYRHKENEFMDFRTQVLLPRMYSTQGPALAKGDVNGDGLDDFFIGSALGKPSGLFLQQKDGKFMTEPSSDVFSDISSENVDATFFDADKDGDQDLYVVTGGYELPVDSKGLNDRLFINTGKGRFIRSIDGLPEMLSSGSCVRAADIDADGDIDLFVGGRLVPGRYPETPESYLLINDGKGKFSDQTSTFAPLIKSAGLVSDAVWTDVNKDSKPDLIVVGEWMSVKFFINNNGKLDDASSSFLKQTSAGWWNSIMADDLDDDGDIDFVLGNFGMNNQLRPSSAEPLTMVYDDFDKNGSVDPILSHFIQHKSYPYPNRDELTDQIPSIKKKFNDYESYSNATLENIFTPEQLTAAKKLEATTFKSSILRNNGDGSFTMVDLPSEAQYAPVFSVVVLDVNKDGHKDLVSGGNLSKTRVRTGKFAGSYGSVFLGDGKLGFTYVPQRESGICVKGDVRKIVVLNDKLIFAVNNSALAVRRLK
jgi:hypothetical protein